MKDEHYTHRDFDGDEFTDHQFALTAEKLHSKAEIAAELGWRDREIKRLNIEHAAEIARLQEELSRQQWVSVDELPEGYQFAPGLYVAIVNYYPSNRELLLDETSIQSKLTYELLTRFFRLPPPTGDSHE